MDWGKIFEMEAELSPGSIEQWLSTVKDGKKSKKGERRTDLSNKVKKHLSALGWLFCYCHKRNKRELRYKSPNGKWFYSLATACLSCLNDDSHQSQPSSPRKLSLESSSDVSNQNQKQKKKRSRVEDCCDTAVFSGDEEKNRIFVLNVEQQTKKRRKTTSEEIGKSLKNILQVMEIKQQKNKSQKESLRLCREDCGPDKNCDVCCVCKHGGDLLLCDGCPSAFHCTCLGLSSLPQEDLWFCPCCCCNICGSVESPVNSKLMNCEQCKRRYHLKCLKEESHVVSPRGWFCSSQCNRVFSELQNLLGCKIAVGDDGDGLVWRLMRAPEEDEHYYDDEQISKLESAVEILHQGFEPSKDLFTGRDLVEELVFRGVGKGFYTVLIEKMKEPVTVAAIRVHKDVAEIPLIATLSNYRRSGICRVLMDELEKQMSRMGVCKLVLPAAHEILPTWIQRFRFSVMESAERLEFAKHGLLDFLGTVMCYKFLPNTRVEDGSAEDSDLTE